MIEMAVPVSVFPEPPLEFRYGQVMHDPHDGLAVFGPYDADSPTQPKSISYGLVGTPRGIDLFQHWARAIQSPIQHPWRNDQDKRLWPMFPGFEAAFNCVHAEVPSRTSILDGDQLDSDAHLRDHNARTARIVDAYLHGIERMDRRDEKIDVAICVVPDIVHRNCRPQSQVSSPQGERVPSKEIKARKAGQMSLLNEFDPDIYQYSLDFRRQIKARSMRYGIPIQIIRESTLALDDASAPLRRGLTTLSDRAWNLGVALYYKSGGKPWRLSTARDGVCYIGIAYRQKDPQGASPTACCAAQLFLDTGDGIVFMGKYGPWYSPKNKVFHQDRNGARELLSGVLRTYQELEGRPLNEIFLHCRSGIDREEFEGFQEACPRGVKLVGIRVRKAKPIFDVRAYRCGKYPVPRGMYWQINERCAYLWASGYKTRLRTYDGWEVPAPLSIDVQHGSADIQQVAKDILGLTKLNYNACKIGESQPVTIKFSDSVGEILVSNPTVTDRKPNFKFYI
jgi:hypothetical protein